MSTSERVAGALAALGAVCIVLAAQMAFGSIGALLTAGCALLVFALVLLADENLRR